MQCPNCRAEVAVGIAVLTMTSIIWLSAIPAAANREWVTQVVSIDGSYNSITVDSTNNVHISYCDWRSMALKYASSASGVWTNHTIDNGNSIDTSVAVDSKDHVYISYGLYENPNWNLKYATNAQGSWANYTLDPGNVRGTSIAIDSNNRIHISYIDDYPDHNLKYVTNADGSWVNHTIDSGGYVGGHTSIVVDPNNKVHISYQRGSVLMYATNTDGGWSNYTLDSTGNAGFYSSIAVDSNNKVHVSYNSANFTSEQFKLRYATNTGGSWSVMTVDENAFSECANSIALDADGKVHISYCGAGASLKYATQAAGRWSTETVDSSGYLAVSNAITVDSNNRVHISYSSGIDKARPNGLRYATNSNAKSESAMTLSVIVGTVAIAAVVVVLLLFLRKRRTKPSTQIQSPPPQEPPTVQLVEKGP